MLWTAEHSSEFRTSGNRELSRLLSAAVINQDFCQLLLDNPESALTAGYIGEVFELGDAERDFVLSIRATSLSDFAAQLESRLALCSVRCLQPYGSEAIGQSVHTNTQECT